MRDQLDRELARRFRAQDDARFHEGDLGDVRRRAGRAPRRRMPVRTSWLAAASALAALVGLVGILAERGAEQPRTTAATPTPGLRLLPESDRCPGGCQFHDVVVSPDDRFVYTLGTRGVEVRRRDLRSGRLGPAAKACGTACVPGIGAVGQLLIAPDGTRAYGATVGGLLVGFDRNPADGRLSPRAGSCVFGSRGVFGTTEVRGCRHVPEYMRLEQAFMSPDGRFVYVNRLDDRSGTAVLAFAPDPSTGGLRRAPGADFRLARGLRSLVFAPDGAHAYAVTSSYSPAGARDVAVLALARDPATGAVLRMPGATGCLAYRRAGCGRLSVELVGGAALKLSADARTLLVAGTSFKGDELQVVERPGVVVPVRLDATSGGLAPPATTPPCLGTVAPCAPAPGLVAPPNVAIAGSRVYITSTGARPPRPKVLPPTALAALELGADGRLRPAPDPRSCVANARARGCAYDPRLRFLGAPVVSGDGRFLYVVDGGSTLRVYATGS